MATFEKRVAGGGQVTWRARVRRLGQPAISRTFDLRQDAEAWARSVERDMDVGDFLPSAKSEKTVFKDIVDDYRNEKLVNLRGIKSAESRLNRLIEYFGEFTLSNINQAELVKYRDIRLQAVGTQSVRHELNLLSVIFKLAGEKGIAVPGGNPVLKIVLPKPPAGRNRRLSSLEESSIIDYLSRRKNPAHLQVFIFALETGARQGEIHSLVWSDVHADKKYVVLRGIDGRETKNGDRSREVPLSPACLKMIQGIPRRNENDKVFAVQQNATKLSFARALRFLRSQFLFQKMREHWTMENKSGQFQTREINALRFKKRAPAKETLAVLNTMSERHKDFCDLHFHDLRHEACSRLASIFAMHELMKILGHRESRSVARYYHPRGSDMAQKFGKFL